MLDLARATRDDSRITRFNSNVPDDLSGLAHTSWDNCRVKPSASVVIL